jgi:hypothetical protein
MSDMTTIVGTAIADSYQMRRISARAIRENLDRQLDWRLDLGMDSEGMHLVSVEEVVPEGTYPEHLGVVVRCRAYLKMVGSRDPLGTEIDLLIRDFAALTPATPNYRGATPEQEKSVVITPRRGDLIPDEFTPQRSSQSRDVVTRQVLRKAVEAMRSRPGMESHRRQALALAKRVDAGEDVLDEAYALEAVISRAIGGNIW